MRMNQKQPSTDGHGNGRRTDGTFGKGNAFGRGNPHARRVARFRSALLNEVKAKDIRQIVRMLVSRALRGNIDAAELVLSRCVGEGKGDLLREAQRTDAAIDEMAEDDEPNETFTDFCRDLGIPKSN